MPARPKPRRAGVVDQSNSTRGGDCSGPTLPAVFRDLVAGDLSATEILDLLGGQGHTVLHDDESAHLFTVFLTRYTRDLDILDLGHPVKEVLAMLFTRSSNCL